MLSHNKYKTAIGGNNLQERAAKQYVEKYLHDEERREAQRVENLAASTGHQVAALDEVLNQKLSMLNERVDSLASQQERLAAQQSDGLTKLGAL